MQYKTAWALEVGIIRDNYMTYLFIFIYAKSRIGVMAFLTVGYEKWQTTYIPPNKITEPIPAFDLHVIGSVSVRPVL